MQGLMQSWPLTVDRILDHAAAWRPQGEIFTAVAEGAPIRTTYAQLASRVRRLAGALADQGVKRGDVVAVLGTNSARQLEAWYAIIGMGAVCQPLNPGLAPDQLSALLAQGGARIVFVDPTLLPAVEPVLQRASRLERVVVMGGAAEAPKVSLKTVAHETLVEHVGRDGPWGAGDENAPAVLVHGVGVSGEPKGTVWSHRSCVLQGMISSGRDALDLSNRDAVMPLVPFWRAAGWGVVFSAPMAGAKLVLPGPRTDALSVRVLADRESASLIIAAPADLQGLYDQYRTENRRPAALRRVIAAGTCCPPALAKSWRDSFGVDARGAWGLVETSSVGGVYDPANPELKPPFGLELEVMDGTGRPAAHDGVSVGRLMARGPVVAGGYFPGDRATSKDGYLDTGDVASVGADGQVRIMGRVEDLITVNGALISPRPIEDAAMEHPSTAEAAVIDGPSGEGPVLVVQRRPGALAGKPDYLRFLGERLGDGPQPVEVLFVDGLPRDTAGRIDRKGLRERLAQRVTPAVAVVPVMADPAAEQDVDVPTPVEPDEPGLGVPLAAVAAAAAAAPVLYAAEHDDAEIEPVAEPGQDDPPTATAELDDAPDAPEIPEAHEAEEKTLPPEYAESADHAEASFEVPPAIEPPPAMDEPAPAPGVAQPEKLLLIEDPDVADPPFATPRSRAALAPPARVRPKRRPGGPAGLFLSFTTLLALAPVVMIAIGAIGIRTGLMDWTIAHDELMSDWPFKLAMVGVVSGILGLFAALMAGLDRFWVRTLVSLLVPIAILAGLIAVKAQGDAFPPVHDVATDWNDPIAFSPALMRLRGPDANPVELDPVVPASAGAYMNRMVAEVNGETCPGARPAILAAPPAAAYARARQAVLTAGLELVTEDPQGGRLEAVATDPWLGLEDDLAVRVRPAGAGAKVDFRAISRFGQSDFGVNCDRVTGLVQAVRSGG